MAGKLRKAVNAMQGGAVNKLRASVSFVRLMKQQQQGGYKRVVGFASTATRPTFDNYRCAAESVLASRPPLKTKKWVSPLLSDAHVPAAARRRSEATPGPGHYRTVDGFGKRGISARWRSPVTAGPSRTSRRQDAVICRPYGPVASQFQLEQQEAEEKDKLELGPETGDSDDEQGMKVLKVTCRGVHQRASAGKCGYTFPSASRGLGTGAAAAAAGGAAGATVRSRRGGWLDDSQDSEPDDADDTGPGPGYYNVTHDSAMANSMRTMTGTGGTMSSVSRKKRDAVYDPVVTPSIQHGASAQYPAHNMAYKTLHDFVALGTPQKVTSRIRNHPSANFGTTHRGL